MCSHDMQLSNTIGFSLSFRISLCWAFVCVCVTPFVIVSSAPFVRTWCSQQCKWIVAPWNMQQDDYEDQTWPNANHLNFLRETWWKMMKLIQRFNGDDEKVHTFWEDLQFDKSAMQEILLLSCAVSKEPLLQLASIVNSLNLDEYTTYMPQNSSVCKCSWTKCQTGNSATFEGF